MPLSAQTPVSLSRRSVSPPPNPSDPPTFKRSLEAASIEGEFDYENLILRTWTSTPSLPSPISDDLTSALNSAVLYGHLSVIRLLLDYGAPIWVSTAALASRDDKPNTLATYECFLQHGWSPQSSASKSRIMTMNLIMFHTDSKSLLQWFLANGAPPNGIPSDPVSPIRYAVISVSSSAIPSLLISHGATIKHTSALHAAASRSGDDASIAMMECLLEAGAELMNWTLHTAAKEESVRRARLLVEKGVDLGKKSRFGYTPRDRAQLSGNEDVKGYLEAVMREKGMEVKDLEIKEEGSEDED